MEQLDPLQGGVALTALESGPVPYASKAAIWNEYVTPVVSPVLVTFGALPVPSRLPFIQTW